ncbi:MAG TPA: nucleotide exchange factor GrpE [Kiritimatiellia bacterium]|nr:nucleotide exchange factor GrpE [Kiritimatiellia bacterium]
MKKTDPVSPESDVEPATAPTAEPAAEPVVEPAPAAESDVDRAQAELETMKDRHLRLQADFDNFRRRMQRERVEAQARASEDLMKALLPVLDHFELGLRSAADHGAEESVRTGFQLVQDELVRVLERSGLAALDAAPGTPFDPHQHEALTHAPSAEHPADTVLQQARRGYRLGGQLLRPVQVVVSSGPAAEVPHGG